MKILKKLSSEELKELISRLNEGGIDQVSEIGEDYKLKKHVFS